MSEPEVDVSSQENAGKRRLISREALHSVKCLKHFACSVTGGGLTHVEGNASPGASVVNHPLTPVNQVVTSNIKNGPAQRI